VHSAGKDEGVGDRSAAWWLVLVFRVVARDLHRVTTTQLSVNRLFASGQFFRLDGAQQACALNRRAVAAVTPHKDLFVARSPKDPTLCFGEKLERGERVLVRKRRPVIVR
jgi:hypothetical protein